MGQRALFLMSGHAGSRAQVKGCEKGKGKQELMKGYDQRSNGITAK